MREQIKVKKARINVWFRQTDFKIMISLLFLVTIGLIMVYSASSYVCMISQDCNFDDKYLLIKQLEFALFGSVGVIGMRYVPHEKIDQMSKYIYIVGLLCILALLTPLGVRANSATRWLNLGVTFQVAEVVKIVVIIRLASIVRYYAGRKEHGKCFLTLWGYSLLPIILLYGISNDLSSSLVIFGIAFGISFIYCGYPKIHMALVGSGVIGSVGLWVWIRTHLYAVNKLTGTSFRFGRLVAWVSPEMYAKTNGHQTLQALYAIGSGGIFGKGLGKSVQKISKIPEAQNDMIFSIICEELGLIGAFMVIYLFCYLIFQLIKISVNRKNIYSSVLATGIWLQIAIQVFINIGVCVNLIPNTGISLPFISYGGTSLVLILFEVGMAFGTYGGKAWKRW